MWLYKTVALILESFGSRIVVFDNVIVCELFEVEARQWVVIVNVTRQTVNQDRVLLLELNLTGAFDEGCS